MILKYYWLMTIISAMLLVVFFKRWVRFVDSCYIIAFALIPIVNWGYAELAGASDIGAAVLANKIVYLGGCFLHILLMLGVFSICNIRIKPVIRSAVVLLSFVLFGFVLTSGHNQFFYKSVSIQKIDGIVTLVKEYGPAHMLFYPTLIITFLVNLGVLIYSYKKHPEVSFRNLNLLVVIDVVCMTVFFGGKILSSRIEFMPFVFVLIQIIYLYIFERLKLYDLSYGITEAFVEKGVNAIVLLDNNMRYLVCNDRAKMVFPELVGARVDSRLPANRETDVIERWINAFEGDNANWRFTFDRDGSSYDVTVNRMNTKGKNQGYAVIMTDVTTERKYIDSISKLNEQMKEATDAAISATNAKSMFLAQMSHEIRTPINAVLGMNEMILRESKDETIREYSENIQTAGQTLLTIINSILDFSKIEDGKMELVSIEYDTAKLISDLYNSIIGRAKGKNLDFELDIDESLPIMLRGDDVRISQIIINLLTNAVKYTEKGKVKLIISNCGRIGDHVTMLVQVYDTGIGIKKEDMQRLFESFTRLDTTRNHSIEGTGLGISIVTGLLDMMDSKLEVESVYGQGSTFSFKIRQQIVNPEPIGNYEERITQRKKNIEADITLYAPDARILVVDDNDMNLKVAANLLKLCGIMPELVNSGTMAIGKVERNKYDIILLDHMMPGMDGIETLRQMKEKKLLDDDTTVVALTANAVLGAKEMYIKNGFDGYLSKPMVLQELIDCISEYLPPEKLSSRIPGQEEETDATDHSGDDNEQSDPIKKLARAGLDTKSGLQFCAGDEQFYKEILADYVDSYDQKCEMIIETYAKEDWKDYATYVHALKSTSDTIGAKELFEDARALELAADEGDVDYVHAHHDKVMTEYRQLVHAIASVL